MDQGTLFELLNITGRNSDKQFVQRILNPDVYPKLYDNPGGMLGRAKHTFHGLGYRRKR